MPSEKQQLTVLNSKKETYFKRVQQCFDLITSLDKPENVKTFKIRARSVDATRAEFLDVLDKINLLSLETVPQYTPNYEPLNVMDDLINKIKDTLDDLASRNPTASTSGSTTQVSNPVSLQTSQQSVAPSILPKIELSVFSGELSQWSSFYQLFRSIVHNNKTLSNIQKFLYLLSCTSGEPHNLIKHLPTTNTHYEIALDILVKRYQCVRHLGTFHLEKLFTIDKLNVGSYNKLRSYYETLSENYSALKALEIKQLGDFVLFHLGFRNLDSQTRKLFETHFFEHCCSSADENKALSEPLPSFNDLLKFLESHCKILESANFESFKEPRNQTSPKNSKGKNYSDPKRTYIATSSRSGSNLNSFKTTSSNPCSSPLVRQNYISSSSTSKPTSFKSKFSSSNVCVVCKHPQTHTIYKCPQFLSFTPSQRFLKLESLGRCTNCCGKHALSICASTSRCFRCNQAHHTLCHSDDVSIQSARQPPLSSQDSSVQQVHTSVTSRISTTSVLLSTAVVHVRNSLGDFVEARVLIDSGAQTSFLTTSFFSRLGLPLRRSNVSVSGVGNNPPKRPKGSSYIAIKPRTSSEPVLNTEVIIMDYLTGKLPSSPVPEDVKNHFSDLPLADPQFFSPSQIDGILGAELFPYVFVGPTRASGPGLPTAIKSIFGWVIMGTVSQPSSVFIHTVTLALEDTLRLFWETEEPPHISPPNPENDIAESIFSSKYKRDDEGRYSVPILIRNSGKHLGGSFGMAMKSLLRLENRFKRNSLLQEEYHAFMHEYIRLGHMRALRCGESNGTYYIPHHAVLNPSSTTTKLRVVFNGSAKTENGISLNDLLFTGAKLQTDICKVISVFRCHRVVFTADICKMFRQIKILPEDLKYQRILWRFSPDDPVTEYILLTVTYGLRSAPFLACRTIRQLAIDEGFSFPKAANILMENTYVDDLMAGEDSVEAALQLQKEIIQLLSRGGFKLRKWSSNHPALLKDVPPEDVQTPIIFESNESTLIKLLGLQWSPISDSFSYKISPFTPRFTKRAILSDISKLYDPLGWLSPVVFLAKCLIQQLWLCGVDWDSDIPSDLLQVWEQYVSQLSQLTHVSFPRSVVMQFSTEISLVAFADASERGYASVVYLHSYNPSFSEAKISILIAKSRVAPLKTLTIPRLELCAASLAARIISYARSSLPAKVAITRTVAFSDSSTVLGWIRTPPHLLKTFVANRVIQILEVLNPSEWHHVSTADNPADCASRGLLPEKLIDHSLWFTGPPWLSLPFEQWPLDKTFSISQDLPDLRPPKDFTVSVVSTSADNSCCYDLLHRYSSFSKLRRIQAWLLRAVRRFKSVTSESLEVLSAEELVAATHHLVAVAQKTHFSEDIGRIKMGKLPSSNSLRTLHPFLDSAGLVRVGGRLRHADLSYDSRHPLLLPKKCLLTDLIIDYFHIKYQHVGPRTLHSLILRLYWIISARQVIRSRLSKCLPCLKMRTTHIQPLMSDLPLTRVRPAKPFLIVGTDFGGPFYMKQSLLRNSRITKMYLCLFVCFVTKAVHLEAVTSLSTEAFLAAFDRFVSRRGNCTDVYSDCGTNYVGASRYFTELHHLLQQNSSRNRITSTLADNNIKWHFNAPSAPHFGGLWESGIKSAKHLVRKVIGDRPLTFEEYATLFCKVEAILNSRPLSAKSTDPHELDALTPGHFLIGGPITAPVESDLTSTPSNRLGRWELVRQASQTFWNRWNREYIATLTQRHKWHKEEPNVKVNDLVLMNDGKAPPFGWKIARITAVHPGPDHVVRVVTVRNKDGEFKRPVVRLALLPYN